MQRLAASVIVAFICHLCVALLPWPESGEPSPVPSKKESVRITLADTPVPHRQEALPDPPRPSRQQEKQPHGQEVRAESNPAVPHVAVAQSEQLPPPQSEPINPVHIHPRSRKKRLPPRPQTDSPPACVIPAAATPEKAIPPILRTPEKAVRQIAPALKAAEKPAVAPVVIRAEPMYSQNSKPAYPPLARRRGQQGTVVLAVTVLKDGSAEQVRVHQSSGYTLLDTSALKTVKKWRFSPGTENGRPEAMEVLVPVRFGLD